MNRIALFLLLAGSSLLSGCWGSGDAKDKSARDAAFKEVFLFEPPPEVSEIKSSWYFMRDSYVRWLRISCDDRTLLKIRSLAGAKPQSEIRDDEKPGSVNRSKNPNAPDWWFSSNLSAETLVIEIDRTKPTETDIIRIWIDQRTRTVYATRTVFN